MSDAPRRERRSPMVMLLDAAMRLAISAQAGPKPRLEVPGRRKPGKGWLTLGGAGALLAVAGAAVIIGALLKGPADLSALAPHAPTRPPATSAPASPSASASPSSSPSTRAPASPPSPAPGSEAAARPAPAPAAPLTARYSSTEGGLALLGYAAGVTIANPGPAGRDGWRITLTLPRPTLQIAEVSGAVATQDGAMWTFEPDKTTRSVPGGGSVRISFQVRGATLLTAAPRDCQIDDRPCTGVGAAPASSG